MKIRLLVLVASVAVVVALPVMLFVDLVHRSHPSGSAGASTVCGRDLQAAGNPLVEYGHTDSGPVAQERS
jgi:hypothetical protein